MSIKTALDFVDAINSHDVERLATLMTEDHHFIDSGGNTGQGLEHMKNGWAGYYEMCPDYKIEIEEIFEKENKVALFGRTSGTYNLEKKPGGEIFFECTAAWKAMVENGKVKLWQVYADWSAFYEKMRENK